MTNPKPDYPSQDFDHSKPLPPLVRLRQVATNVGKKVEKALGTGSGKNIMGEREHIAINKANIKKQIERGKKARGVK